jgi:hypothetical protein
MKLGHQKKFKYVITEAREEMEETLENQKHEKDKLAEKRKMLEAQQTREAEKNRREEEEKEETHKLEKELAKLKREEILREAQERTLGRSTRDADTEDQQAVSLMQSQ